MFLMIIKLEGLVNNLFRLFSLINSVLEVNRLKSINDILYTGVYLFLEGAYNDKIIYPVLAGYSYSC